MKRIISLLITTICAVMMFSTLAFATETQSESTFRINRREYDTLYVKTDGGNLNVRKDAGTEYAIVGKLANGTKIISWSVFGKTDSQGRSWTSIKAKDINGKTISGWVLDDYLTGTPPTRSIPVGIGPDVG